MIKKGKGSNTMEKKNTIKVILTEEEKQILEKAAAIIDDLTAFRHSELFILDDIGEWGLYNSNDTYTVNTVVSHLTRAEEIFITLEKE